MTDRDFSVYPVKFETDLAAVPRRVRSPDGLRPGSIVLVDIGTVSTTIVFGQEIKPLPHWIECEIEANISADILVKRKGT